MGASPSDNAVMRRLLPLLALCATSATAQPNAAWGRATDDAVVMVVHGGAGGVDGARLSTEDEVGLRAGLERALRAGHALLLAGGSSVDAVEAAIKILEDDSLFNSGRGAVLAYDGTARHDASIMNGASGAAGASAGTMHVRHPISLARAVMEQSPHVMLSGVGAEEFARLRGLETVSNAFFITAAARRSLEAAQRAETAVDTSRRGEATASPDPGLGMGTAGAVALDQAGHLAAGTSTGGMTNKRWDRIGDSPIIGAGTYASDATCAVSSTGHGEYFIRLAVAHDISARVAYLRESCAEAADHLVHRTLRSAGGQGGVIVLDASGQASMPFNSGYMARGTISRGGRIETHLYEEDNE